MKSFAILFCLLFGLVTAQDAPKLRVEAALEPVYLQGQGDEVELRIVLNDPAETLKEGVLFLNVVERDAARGWPQAAHKIFTSAEETPAVFRQPYTGTALRTGVTTSLAFELRAKAKPGDYALVVQLYEGSVTDPNRVSANNRVALKAFHFSIVR